MRTGNDTPKIGSRARLFRLVAGSLAVLPLFSAGCRKDMYDQPKYEAYDPSTFFPDGTSSRGQIEGTVARNQLRESSHYYEGIVNGKYTDEFPFEVTKERVEKGRERYLIFCSPCHARTGDGRGMVVRRGFSPPPTFHGEYLRKKPVGHFFNVITNGHGAMYSYAARIPVEERWDIIAFIRALQYSRDASMDDLTAEERQTLAETSK